jgi:hypothetical protein
MRKSIGVKRTDSMARPKLYGEEMTKMVNFRMRVSLYKTLQEQGINTSKLLNGLLAIYLSNGVPTEELGYGPAENRTPNLRCVRATS